MIRHKATGTELAWRPTSDRWGDEGTGWALEASDGTHAVVFSYPTETESAVYVNGLHEDSYQSAWRWCLDGRDEVLAKAVELGVVEIIDDPPAAVTSAEKDYDSVHRVDSVDFDAYVDALATVAGYEKSPLSIRVAAICELRRLALED